MKDGTEYMSKLEISKSKAPGQWVVNIDDVCVGDIQFRNNENGDREPVYIPYESPYGVFGICRAQLKEIHDFMEQTNEAD